MLGVGTRVGPALVPLLPVLGGPHGLCVRKVKTRLTLGCVSQVKRRNRPDVIDVPAVKAVVCPSHAGGESGLQVLLEVLHRAAQ